MSLLDGVPLPAAGANVPIGCPTCHVPHQATANPPLLRNPLASTNDFFLTTSDVFTNRYDPAINLCGQCHNHRGASWTDTQDAPHHSPQYNFLVGTVGELAPGSATWNPATHAGLPESAQYSISGTFYLTNQCASCHMQDDAAPAGTASHTFTDQLQIHHIIRRSQLGADSEENLLVLCGGCYRSLHSTIGC